MENNYNLEEQQFVDIFANPPAEGGDGQDNQRSNVPKFGGGLDQTADMFSTTTTTTQAASPEEGDQSTTTTTTVEGQDPNDVDILGQTDKKQAGRKPKYDFSDAQGYFTDRIKNGKFVAVEEELEDGSKRIFTPKTPEEFDELIDIQINHQLDQERKVLEQKIYNSKSPAWQAVLKYSEMTEDPSEVIPFIQGIQTIESVAQVDETQPEGAEIIVRTRLAQRGDPKDVIDDQIEVLKTSDKLISTAQKYKPIILTEEKQQLAQMVQERKRQDAEYEQIVQSVRENAIKAIESPIFGKTKLKQEEKLAIYDLIGEPDEESQGYKIYSAIDNLFSKGNFETLKKVALLLAKEEAFVNYISTSAADKTAEGIQRKLRVSTEGRGPASEIVVDDNRQTVRRDTYKPLGARFGRYDK